MSVDHDLNCIITECACKLLCFRFCTRHCCDNKHTINYRVSIFFVTYYIDTVMAEPRPRKEVEVLKLKDLYLNKEKKPHHHGYVFLSHSVSIARSLNVEISRDKAFPRKLLIIFYQLLNAKTYTSSLLLLHLLLYFRVPLPPWRECCGVEVDSGGRQLLE